MIILTTILPPIKVDRHPCIAAARTFFWTHLAADQIQGPSGHQAAGKYKSERAVMRGGRVADKCVGIRATEELFTEVTCNAGHNDARSSAGDHWITANESV